MTVTLIGAGNLATQLGLALHERGIRVMQVYSRTEKSAKTLAERIGADYTTDAKDINDGADFYIYSLKDYALEDVISQTAAHDGVHLHTAGSVSMDIFRGKKKKHQTTTDVKIEGTVSTETTIETTNSRIKKNEDLWRICLLRSILMKTRMHHAYLYQYLQLYPLIR